MEKKQTVGIVFGGKSQEHEVSLMSASNVMEAINTEKYNIIKIGITKEGKWMIYDGSIENIRTGYWEKDDDNLIKDFSIFDHTTIKSVDVFFPILHGPNGEDGTIQGLFELLNKPYVGCGVLASSVGMDKVYSKILFKEAQIPQGEFVVTDKKKWESNSTNVINEVEKSIGYPVFIKPANMGSSVGISKASNEGELRDGIEQAAKYDNKILLEQFINCREIECAVLGDYSPKASVLGEIIPSQEFYDYEAKYSDNENSVLVIPAKLDDEISDKIREYAIKAFKAINGSGLSRVDFFIEKETGEIFINEINTMPGFTNISMYPKLWAETGMPYDILIEKLIELAIRKKN